MLICQTKRKRCSSSCKAEAQAADSTGYERSLLALVQAKRDVWLKARSAGRGRLSAPILPYDQELAKHGDRPAARQLAEPAVEAELLVSHAHVLLVSLRSYPVPDGFKLCSGSSLIDLQQRRVPKVWARPVQESP